MLDGVDCYPGGSEVFGAVAGYENTGRYSAETDLLLIDFAA